MNIDNLLKEEKYLGNAKFGDQRLRSHIWQLFKNFSTAASVLLIFLWCSSQNMLVDEVDRYYIDFNYMSRCSLLRTKTGNMGIKKGIKLGLLLNCQIITLRLLPRSSRILMMHTYLCLFLQLSCCLKRPQPERFSMVIGIA